MEKENPCWRKRKRGHEGVVTERVPVSDHPQLLTEVKSLALEKLEEIAQQVVDFLSKYNLTYDEMFYVLGYVERSLNMDMVEEMLEDFGLINSEEGEEEG